MRHLLVILLCILSCTVSKAQTITYAYDSSGNRISRTVVLAQSKNAPEYEQITAISEVLGEVKVTVSPNPTEGIVRVNVSYSDAFANGILSVHSTSGAHILSETLLSGGNTIDLSTQPNGIYLLRIESGDYKNTWKIIKK